LWDYNLRSTGADKGSSDQMKQVNREGNNIRDEFWNKLTFLVRHDKGVRKKHVSQIF
jgi:hypothetical protein